MTIPHPWLLPSKWWRIPSRVNKKLVKVGYFILRVTTTSRLLILESSLQWSSWGGEEFCFTPPPKCRPCGWPMESFCTFVLVPLTWSDSNHLSCSLLSRATYDSCAHRWWTWTWLLNMDEHSFFNRSTFLGSSQGILPLPQRRRRS